MPYLIKLMQVFKTQSETIVWVWLRVMPHCQLEGINLVKSECESGVKGVVVALLPRNFTEITVVNKALKLDSLA
jgi:hypothetical protein